MNFRPGHSRRALQSFDVRRQLRFFDLLRHECLLRVVVVGDRPWYRFGPLVHRPAVADDGRRIFFAHLDKGPLPGFERWWFNALARLTIASHGRLDFWG